MMDYTLSELDLSRRILNNKTRIIFPQQICTGHCARPQISMICPYEAMPAKNALWYRPEPIEDYEPEKEKPNGQLTSFQESRKDEQYACTVNALLAHPGYHDRKYDISLEELKRRVTQPESLNKVDMIAYLRMAKTKARVFLKSKNIQLTKQNRKARHSVLTKLCELECQELAKGIRTLNDKYFPVSEVSRRLIADRKKTSGRSPTAGQLNVTRIFLRSLKHLIDNDTEMKALEDYDRTTHTFGRQHLSNTLGLLQTIVDDVISKTD